jgi:hypothetical protein
MLFIIGYTSILDTAYSAFTTNSKQTIMESAAPPTLPSLDNELEQELDMDISESDDDDQSQRVGHDILPDSSAFSPVELDHETTGMSSYSLQSLL